VAIEAGSDLENSQYRSALKPVSCQFLRGLQFTVHLTFMFGTLNLSADSQSCRAVPAQLCCGCARWNGKSKVPEVVDQSALQINPDPVTDAISGAPDTYWETLLSDTSFILTSTLAASHQAALENLLDAAEQALNTDPERPILLVEGWPQITAFPPTEANIALWYKMVEIYHPQYLKLVEDVRAALPEATVQALSLGSVLSEVLAIPALFELTPEMLFPETAPEGGETVTAIAGIIVKAALSETPLPYPTEEMDILPATVLASYSEIAEAAWEAVGSTLVVAKDPEEVEPPEDTVPLTLLGTPGDDLIVLTEDATAVQGDAGTDTLVVSALSDTVKIEFSDTGDILLNVSAQSETVTLQDIERIGFSDGTLAFDEDGLAGQAYRLYQACFDRTPDAEGLGFWIKQLDAGSVTLYEAAQYFLNSEEFASVYGTSSELSDVHYLALLYANVLDRAPDTEGFSFWRDEQVNGVTRADMLVYFSESAENVAQVAPAIDDGIWYV